MDGESIRTPASHGQWGGFNAERAVAWVIDVGWPAGKSIWYARCGAKSWGPGSLAKAKSAAVSLLVGEPLDGAFAGGIDINAISARLMDSAGVEDAIPEPETFNDQTSEPVLA